MINCLSRNINKYLFKRTVIVNQSQAKEEIKRWNSCSFTSNYDFRNDKCDDFPEGSDYSMDLMDGKLVNTSCAIHYYFENNLDDQSGPKCIKCTNDKISSLTKGHQNNNCTIENNYDLKDVLKDGKIEKCNTIVENSIGRENGTHPLSIHCKCPNNLPKVFDIGNSKLVCLGLENLKKIINPKVLDYAVYNNASIDSIVYRFSNCDPWRDDYNIKESCLCPPGFIFIEFKCKKCVKKAEITANDKQMCAICHKNQHLSLDGTRCMCLYSNIPQSKDCKISTTEESHCTGNLVAIDGKCEFCPENKIKSKISEECICSYSLKKLDKNCSECEFLDGSSEPCKCGGDSSYSDGSCICNSFQYLQNTIICDNCTKGFVRNKTDHKSCICSPGKFINEKKECIACPKNSFNALENSNNCTNCPLFRNNSFFGAKSSLQCKELDVSKVVVLGIIISVLLILALICFLILYFKGSKGNKSGENNVNADNRPPREYLNYEAVQNSSNLARNSQINQYNEQNNYKNHSQNLNKSDEYYNGYNISIVETDQKQNNSAISIRNIKHLDKKEILINSDKSVSQNKADETYSNVKNAGLEKKCPTHNYHSKSETTKNSLNKENLNSPSEKSLNKTTVQQKELNNGDNQSKVNQYEGQYE
ncbi:MAG: hypothetical protein MHPSP_001835 [Paramarteilia canceri]